MLFRWITVVYKLFVNDCKIERTNKESILYRLSNPVCVCVSLVSCLLSTAGIGCWKSDEPTIRQTQLTINYSFCTAIAKNHDLSQSYSLSCFLLYLMNYDA